MSKFHTNLMKTDECLMNKNKHFITNILHITLHITAYIKQILNYTNRIQVH